MRSITLSSQSVLLLRPHSLPSSSKPLKSHHSYLNSRFTNQTSNLSSSSPTVFLSRYARQQCVNMYKEFKFLNCNACKATQWTNDVDDYDGLDKSPSKKKIGGRNSIPNVDDYNASNTPFHCYLKFTLLFGLFSLGGSQQAVAGSDFASGLQSISFFGDLGDISTGFASALLAARNSSAVIFIGTFGALATMTIISVVLGRTFHYVDDILPFRFGDTDLPVDDIAAVCLLVYFGVSTLLDANSGDGLKAEEEQKEAELAVSEFSGNGAGILAAANTVISTFLLVFVAEWGDKSFFSTIALAAASSPLGVIGGALAGHGVATLLAVLGGSLLGTFLSEKVIAYVGGTLFLVFAAVTLIEIVS
ncbi:GDT1-like protein 1, chloroplastic isoform X2 [Camellia sinensis]|uniref:GDT1-like protein 1, chloroplastic isoform X2 n=1 Tax=Camellia sinensis TaxID=4442 RepID=UPI001036B7A1|nr:GDT1-like protein 1, chloroplastic isoform X2 [Camellia sinensis]